MMQLIKQGNFFGYTGTPELELRLQSKCIMKKIEKEFDYFCLPSWSREGKRHLVFIIID